MKKPTIALLISLLLVQVAAAANLFDGLPATATSCRRWAVLTEDLADHAAGDSKALYDSYVEREVQQERARIPAPATDAQRKRVDRARARLESTTRLLAKMAWAKRSATPRSTADSAYNLCLENGKSPKAPVTRAG